MAEAAAVEARGWGWRHAGRRPWALDGLDLVIEAGERVLLLGPSGSGKSTLLAALAGVLAEDQGESRGALLVDGRPPRATPGRAGLVLQDPQSQVILPRVGDDAAFGAENLGVPADEVRSRVVAALAAVGLDIPLDATSTRLSGGRQQRLALAGVLAMRPGLVLLDEPTANLDPAGVTEVRDAVVSSVAATGATLLVVEHRVAVWADAVDRVVVLGADGAVVADGAPAAVLAAQGRSLAEQGVWVPGRSPAIRRAPLAASGPVLATSGLLVGRDRRPVLAVPDLELPSGRLTALTGPNGLGKTTLALTLGGLLPPVAGSVVPAPWLAGGLRGGPSEWRSRDLLGRVSVVFQSPQHQFLAGTVRDELAVGPRALRRPPRAVAARVDELLERLDLVRLADANPFTLSGGQQRRLSVGSALAVPPRLLLLDEPTFGQDARTWAALVELLLEGVDDGAAVVAATHDPELVALADGRVALEHERAVLA
ncbi:ABC transporter ATP-binding protein [Amnibacterium sp.]|uniref:ABC transporter ATP-binding protein n=1 Tax=Amnibacterium sp. TaxID=1872496 RepID=UPI0026230FEC|nr:ATP-binding cassette domain-containing protein [Amnibacterium sp.]MCU1472215.1 transporter ATP-binding protein [Amnibacterium sp.]